MLTDKDIKKLESVFATKDDLKNFATKDDFKNLKLDLISAMEKVFPTRIEMNSRFDDMRDDFSDLQTSVDAYAKDANTYFQETDILATKVNRI